VVGLCAAMMLAQDGHEVTVLEADPDPVPSRPVDAWETWTRKGVAQFHQPHNQFARFHRVLDEELPGMGERLLDVGCVWVDYAEGLPPSISDTESRPGDENLRFATGRRPVVEAAIAKAAEGVSGLSVRRGVRVAELVPGARATDGTPHVAGVRTAAGEDIRADLVVDAMGRRSPAPAWLVQLGAREPYEEAEDSGFVYYTRYFRGPVRPSRVGRALVPIGSISLLTLDSDNDTWSVTVFGRSRDTPLKRLRDVECFERVVRACPRHAHWLDGGEPITDIVAMAGILDRYRRFSVDGRPVATGFAAVGDSWACTNPSAARGLSIGLIHAQALRHTARETLERPADFAEAWDARTEEAVAPYYRNQIAADRARIAEMTALAQGLEPPPNESIMARFVTAAGYDADVYRSFVETVLCLALPQEVLERPGLVDKIEKYRDAEPLVTPGPDRRELLELLEP
jgi:2-polyprenyl-6-methoxyphenol hydroxylase-like FAD-dependent oxidoreductase